MGCSTSSSANVSSEPAKKEEAPAESATPTHAPKSEDPKPAMAAVAKAEPEAAPEAGATPILADATIIFVLGGPGAGKGTQCDRIIAKYEGVKHFSAGDLLRDAVANGNTELEAIMKEGKLVPMEVTIRLLKDAMVSASEKVFLIDGFPRALDQGQAFESQIRPCDMVLAFDCPEDVMRERLLERGKTSGRADDNEETIVKRFRTFVEQSKPVIEYYKEQGKCAEISSVGAVDDIFANVCGALESRLLKITPKPAAEGVAVLVAAAGGAAADDGAVTLPAGARIIFVLGGPGSGKGTQCDKILAEYADCGVHHFSAGDLLRQAVQDGNSELEAIMKEGKLVPVEVTIGLLKDAMLKSGGSTFLIDGFPRAWDQAQTFESMIQPCDAVLFFDCTEEVMRERLLERGKTSGRADDNEETIVKRFRTFVEQSKPVIDEYDKQGKCFTISSMQAPDAVFGEVKTALDGLLRPEKAAEAGGVAGASDGAQVPADSKIIFVLGGPGAGKGTQCERILAKYSGVFHFSAGDLLRQAVTDGNAELEAIMKEGKLVPMEVTIGLLKDAMIKCGGSVFLIDGFPRAWDQAQAFEAMVKPCDAVIFFDCPEEVMRERLLERGKSSGRADDNEETIVKRFRTFVEQSKPVVEEYEKQGKVFSISAVPGPDEVFEEVAKALDTLL